MTNKEHHQLKTTKNNLQKFSTHVLKTKYLVIDTRHSVIRATIVTVMRNMHHPWHS